MAFRNPLRYVPIPVKLRILPFVFRCKLLSEFIRVNHSTFAMAAAENTAYVKQGKDLFTLSVVVNYSKLNFHENVVIVRPIGENLNLSLLKLSKKVTAQMEKLAKRKLKKKKEILEIPDVRTVLFCGEAPVDDEDVPCDKVFELNGQLRLQILDAFYDVIINSPWVDNIALPTAIMPDTEIFPVKFETSYVDAKLSTFTWYRSGEKYESLPPKSVIKWDVVGDGFYYRVKKEDAGHYLKLVCFPKNEKMEGPEFSVVTSKPVLPPENDYYFVQNHRMTDQRTDDNGIRIVDYNILADIYANTKEAKIWFDYCPQFALDINIRAPVLCTEISGYNADIICLQEVQSNVFYKYFQPQLRRNHFEGDLVVKHNAGEGLACFYNSNKFVWLTSSSHYYASEIVQHPALSDILSIVEKNETLFDKLKSLPHCVQFVALSSLIKMSEVIVITNVHLSSFSFEGVKVMQIGMTIALLEHFINKLKSEMPKKNFSIIICGDFNSTPDSEVYELMNKGLLGSNHALWEKLFPEAEKVFELRHSFNLKSSYGTPQYTNYTRHFKGCLDYIFYDTNSFDVTQIVPLPEEKELEENVGLPSTKFPSDHLPLIVDLQWTK